MTYNFDNIAIKCDTWQQMERLAEIAEKQGYKVNNQLLDELDFDVCNFSLFMIDDEGYCINSSYSRNPIVSFTTFITSHPDYSVEGC